MSQSPIRTVVYDSSTQSFRTLRCDKDTGTHSITISNPFKWHIIDTDRDLRIYLDFESALEVEAGYQLWRRHLAELNNPKGEEGQLPMEPPKEIKGNGGYYHGKNYRISFDAVVASRASKNAICGQHVQCYQENGSTGFMRTLHREPQESYSKPCSGLRVETKAIRNDDLELVIEVASGKSHFGYEYERTWFTFPNVDDDTARNILVQLAEDGELFRLEVERSPNDRLSVFPGRGVARKAHLKIKSCQFVRDLKVDVNRSTDPSGFDVNNVVDLEGNQFEGEQEDEEKEGEMRIPCKNNLMMMMMPNSVEDCLSLSKFDKYSYMDRVHKINDCVTQYCPRFNKFHLDDDDVHEYKQHHFGEFPLCVLRNQKKLFRLCVDQMRKVNCLDVSCLIVNNDEKCDIVDVVEVPSGSSIVRRDAVYNKLTSWINETTMLICLVTARVSSHFRRDYGEEGMNRMREEVPLSNQVEVEDSQVECGDFVTYLGFGKKMMLLTDEIVQTFSRV